MRSVRPARSARAESRHQPVSSIVLRGHADRITRLAVSAFATYVELPALRLLLSAKLLSAGREWLSKRRRPEHATSRRAVVPDDSARLRTDPGDGVSPP